jgi:signal transduction histidine kinase/ligand-binding sensor domain-containing protein
MPVLSVLQHVRWLCVAAASVTCALALDPGLLISQYQKKHWQVEDGLPHNYVMAVLPGPDGYLLVGTDEGLARFDGVRFLPYDLDASLELSKRWVLSILTARDGSLWVGTFDGGLYQWRNGRVITRVEKGASVFAILEDSAGRIWASTRSGVIRGTTNGFEVIRQLARPPDTAWNVLAMDTQGAVWIVSDGLYRCRENKLVRVAATTAGNGQILSVHARAGGGIDVGTSEGLFEAEDAGDGVRLVRRSGVPGPVVSILRDADDNLWAGTWGKGLYRVHRNRVESWSSREGLPDDFVRTLYADREGNLWIGVRGGGLCRWKNPTMVPLGIPEGLSGDFASTVVQDRAGDLWLGTWRGGLYHVRHGVVKSQKMPVAPLFLTVRAFAVDALGNAWIGNWEGVARFDGKTYRHFSGPESPYRHVAALLFDTRGRLWVGTSDQGVLVFPSGEPSDSPGTNLLRGQEITSLEEDAGGNIWVGTTSGAGWVPPGGQPVFHPARELPRDSVASLSKDSKQRIWACTLGGAIWQLTTSGSRILDSRHGLPSHPLYRALDDNAGSMWISSPKGILRLSFDRIEHALAGALENLNPTTYEVDDGMRTIECHRLSQPAGGIDREGNVWFPTTKGFVKIPPRREPSVAPPPVFVEDSSSEGVAPANRAELNLQSGSHNLAIRFTALHFGAPEKIRFRYRMEGFDQAWIPDSGTRTARYNRLPPGDYRFLVSASLPGGAWSEPPAAIFVHQLPQFSQTRWFVLLLALATAAAVTAVFRWRVHIIRQRYAAVIAERNRIGREWHDTLVAGFSAISLQLDAAMFRLGDQSGPTQEVLEMTRKMVHHYRAEARRVIWDLRDNRPDSESLVEAVSSALRQATFGKAIEGTIAISGEAVRAPREMEHNLLRICQEALANAIRHGQPQHLRLEVEYATDVLKVRIQDDGKGFDPECMNGLNGGHFGLTVMAERARRFGGTLHLESRLGSGTVVEAAMPIAQDEHHG